MSQNIKTATKALKRLFSWISHVPGTATEQENKHMKAN